MIRPDSMAERRSSPVLPVTRLLQAVLALALVLASGCGRKDPEAGPQRELTRVTILVENTLVPMRNYQTILLEKLIRTRPRMEVKTLRAGDDAAVQTRQVKEAVDAGAKFLLVFPQDAAALAPALREAMARGARVIVFSPDIPEDACTSAIFADERRLGQIAGDHVVAALKTKAQEDGLPAPAGRVVMLRGDEEGTASRRRAEGFVSAIQSLPGIVLVHDAPANWNEKDAADRIREALRIQKHFDVVYAQNDLIAAGASKAVREADAAARESMLIMGTDGVPGPGAGVAMVLSGELEATIYNPPLVDLAWAQVQTLLDEPAPTVPKRTQVKPFVIAPDNALPIQEAGLPEPEVE